MNVPTIIQCRVQKRSQWYRYDKTKLKSISLEIIPGRHFCVGDENSGDYYHGVISLTASNDVECCFDKLEVGQIVELEIKPVIYHY